MLWTRNNFLKILKKSHNLRLEKDSELCSALYNRLQEFRKTEKNKTLEEVSNVVMEEFQQGLQNINFPADSNQGIEESINFEDLQQTSKTTQQNIISKTCGPCCGGVVTGAWSSNQENRHSFKFNLGMGTIFSLACYSIFHKRDKTLEEK